MRGMSATTGKPLDGIDHLRQSIITILTTPIGSRVMRREFGSNLWKLIDAPLNEITKVNLYAATINALLKWEPRITPIRVNATASAIGRVTLSLVCMVRESGQLTTFDGLIISTR